MNGDVFRVLDEGVSSSHLDRDGVGPLGQECEGDAAVQGDEGLQEGKATALLSPGEQGQDSLPCL